MVERVTERVSVMRTTYDPTFLSPSESAELQLWLTEQVPWRIETFKIFGKQQYVPRLSAWYGDQGTCYRYTGIDHVAEGWPNELRALRQKLLGVCSSEFNFVILNRYRDGSDYMGWHRDAESGAHKQIASISVGAERAFKLEESTGTREFNLSHGSLLLFDGHLRHQLPKRLRQKGERINLTFRAIDG